MNDYCGTNGCYQKAGFHMKPEDGTRQYLNKTTFPMGDVLSCDKHYRQTLHYHRMIMSGQDVGEGRA